MRTYGRIVPNILYPDQKQWVKVETAPNGDNSDVWITTLIQTLKLNLGESPFWGNYGIPAFPSVATQVAPDYYAIQTQMFYAQYFLSLIIARAADTVDEVGNPQPTYNVSAITKYGAKLTAQVAT